MTAMAVARSGDLRSHEIGAILPFVRGAPVEHTSVELLLAHRAGLRANLPLFRPRTHGLTVSLREALTEAAHARRPEALGPAPSEGFEPLYSDLGYMLVGEAVATSLGAMDMGAVITDRVAAPLGLAEELGPARELERQGSRVGFLERVAPTEVVDWRGGVIRGRVHDENAFALRGDGACGHAGMFGTVRSVLRFGTSALDAIARGEGPLRADDGDPTWLVRERPGGTLRAGFDGKSKGGASTAGERCGPRTFGHLGFTGTSLWIDPDAQAVVVLLTNRVHPTRESQAIRAARPVAHDALFSLAHAVGFAFPAPAE
jgi:CubicO group peptidase (beta-lactamase class C family)